MASTLAKADSCSNTQVIPTMSNQENGTRNKRKFQPDTSSGDLNKAVSVSDWPSYEFSANKIEKTQNHGHGNVCAECGTMHDHSDAKLNPALSTVVGSFYVGPSGPREEIDAYDELHDITDWSDLTESQLEELVLINLDTMFKSAIKKIMAFGYNKDVSTKAVLRSGILYGCKDPVSNIVDNAMTFIKNGLAIDPTIEHYFDCLQQMEKYTLVELVCILRDVKNFNSTGNALWCLLICDMNVAQACAMDIDASNSLATHVEPNQSDSSPPSQAQLGSELTVGSKCCLSKKSSNKNRSLVSNGTCRCEPNITCSTPIADNYRPDFATAKSSFDLNGRNDNKTPAFDGIDKSFVPGDTAYCHAPGQKSATSRKSSGVSKRDHILRQKSLHMEKNGRPHSSKGSSGSRKVYGFGGSILDKKVKPVLDSMSHNLKHASLNASKNAPQDNKPHNLSATFNNPEAVNVVSSSYSSTNTPLTSRSVSSLPLANRDLSLSSPLGNYSNGNGNGNSGMPNDQSINNGIAQSKKDDMILKLVPKVRELQNQLQEWTEWANQKVMQVTRRLSKDKAEIKTLRQDREEVERLKKETETLEENTMKKLPEMEKALGKASGQVERANAAVRRLEVDNAALRQNMESAKLLAAETAATYLDVLEREKKSLLKYQSRGKENTLFHEELTSDRHMLAQLQQKIEQAKDFKEKLEERWKREEKAKEELQCHVNSIRKERDEAGRLYKSKEDDIKVKIASSMLKYKEDVAGLEKGISELRLKSDSSKIEALRRGLDGRRSVVSKEELEMVDLLSGIGRMHLQELDDREEDEYCVKRERECVMCLFQEMVVVFLPCAHQVVCVACNELHKNQGMTECPSCRTFIDQRIHVRFAHT